MAAATRPRFNFKFDRSASPFTASQQAYLKSHPEAEYRYIATGALVFDTADATAPRLLLIKRAAGDSMPNRWEVPGGGCDDEDESILHAVARELWEEAGLTATQISAPMGSLISSPADLGRKSASSILWCNLRETPRVA